MHSVLNFGLPQARHHVALLLVVARWKWESIPRGCAHRSKPYWGPYQFPVLACTPNLHLTAADTAVCVQALYNSAHGQANMDEVNILKRASEQRGAVMGIPVLLPVYTPAV